LNLGLPQLDDLTWGFDEEGGGKERGLQPGFIASDDIHPYLELIDSNAFRHRGSLFFVSLGAIGMFATKVN
jgi:hypothetical protein